MTAPAINTLEYLRHALSKNQNSAVVSQNVDGTLSITVDIGPGVNQIALEPLQGPPGGPGLPQFPLMLMPDVYTDPKDLPFDLTNTAADVGKYWLITQSDANGVILTGAFIWFGTEYRFLPFGVQGRPGGYGVIKPYVTLMAPDNTSDMQWSGGGTPADPYRLTVNLSVPIGPLGESCPLFNMPDVSHDTPPITGDFLTYMGNTVTVGSDSLPVWEPSNAGDFTMQPYVVPSAAFRNYSDVTFDNPTTIATFAIPPNPFEWKPLVFGQIEMHGGSSNWWDPSLPEIGVIVILGDPDPEVGTLVARGFGNAAGGVVTVVPHCSVPDSPLGRYGPRQVGLDSIAMTPWNDVGAVAANNSGGESTLYVLIVNEGKQYGQSVTYDFNVHGSSLFVLACPMTSQDQLAPPQYGSLSVRVKLNGLVQA